MAQNELPLNDQGTSVQQASREIQLRLWPAVVITVVYLLVSFGFSKYGSTNIQSFIALVIVPLSAAALLLLWWLGFSRIPVRQRLLGLVLAAAFLSLPVFAQKAHGVLILAYALPAAMIGVVVTMAITYWLPWKTQRWVALGYIIVCAGVCMALRVDSIGGDLKPVVSWRWSPSLAELSKSLPRVEAHGTAVLPAELTP
ncbi:MAG: hypothetical protein K1Y02_14305, partial [Candidatus Hydrogenedentes bacterium]|nr:hypothetical protein [Candidatus Hydrogenedentota bacterium]